MIEGHIEDGREFYYMVITHHGPMGLPKCRSHHASCAFRYCSARAFEVSLFIKLCSREKVLSDGLGTDEIPFRYSYKVVSMRTLSHIREFATRVFQIRFLHQAGCRRCEPRTHEVRLATSYGRRESRRRRDSRMCTPRLGNFPRLQGISAVRPQGELSLPEAKQIFGSRIPSTGLIPQGPDTSLLRN